MNRRRAARVPYGDLGARVGLLSRGRGCGLAAHLARDLGLYAAVVARPERGLSIGGPDRPQRPPSRT